MPWCNGKNGCKIGKPHEIASKDLVSKLSKAQLKQVVNKTMRSVKAECGGRAVLGKRAIQYARSLFKQPVSAIPDSFDKLTKLFDDAFTSRMELKAPGVYLLEDGKPIAFVSLTGDKRIISREIFSPDMTKEEVESVLSFIKTRIPEAHLQESSDPQPMESAKT